MDQRLWIELFALANVGGLAADIYLAHSMNRFREPTEYVPLAASLASPVLLLAGLVFSWRGRLRWWSVLGGVVGCACIAVGVAGMMLHLESSFFQSRTLASLVYSAPFAAPLAYTGLGLLLLMNRMVPASDPDWAMWVLLLALGGYLGNFVFSVTDHAQNGFFVRTEWIGVVMGAFGAGFLFAPFVSRVGRRELALCAGVMVAGMCVGGLGLFFHLSADVRMPNTPVMDRLVFGAPVFAPLLFVDMGVLALIGLWALDRSIRRQAEERVA
ncbi:MAG TPA: hypothetical protein VHC70_10405 [Phycisphaerales bacterium]|nr:hypothetical protein [Phycisphaerales bacterium]